MSGLGVSAFKEEKFVIEGLSMASGKKRGGEVNLELQR